MNRRSLARCLLSLGVALSLLSVASRASDATFEQLFAAKEWDAAEKLARERLAAAPDSAGAAADVARVIIEANRRDQFEEAAQLLEQAIAREPDRARHHFYLGQAYGRLAQDAGFGGLSLAGKSRTALARAAELEPRSFQYVYALNEYYLDAPAIAGGSVGRAREAARAFEPVDRDAATLLHAQVLIREKEYAAAITKIASVTRRDDALINLTRRNLLSRAGFALLEARKYAEARKVFETVATDFPNNAAGHLGLGRARHELGDHAGAITALRRSVDLDGHPDTWYRIGLAYQASGDKEQAAASFRRSLEIRDTGKTADEARRRLAALGG